MCFQSSSRLVLKKSSSRLLLALSEPQGLPDQGEPLRPNSSKHFNVKKETHLDYSALWTLRLALTQVSLRDPTHLDFYNVEKENYHSSLSHEAYPDQPWSMEPLRPNSSKHFNDKKETCLDYRQRSERWGLP